MPSASVTKRPTDEKEPYQEAARPLATLLHGQTIFIDSVKLVDADNEVNAKALGYIYGLADCALRLAKLDVASEHGAGLLVFSFRNLMNLTPIGYTNTSGRLQTGPS